MNWKVPALLVLLSPLASGKGARGPVDKDQDGLPDSWERRYFETAEDCVADDDSDGDGLSNLQEFLGGSHPLEAKGAHVAESGGGGGGGGSGTSSGGRGNGAQAASSASSGGGAASSSSGYSGSTLSLGATTYNGNSVLKTGNSGNLTVTSGTLSLSGSNMQLNTGAILSGPGIPQSPAVLNPGGLVLNYGSGGLIKASSGLTLTGTNTYTGNTVVTTGTLSLNAVTPSLSGANAQLLGGGVLQTGSLYTSGTGIILLGSTSLRGIDFASSANRVVVQAVADQSATAPAGMMLVNTSRGPLFISEGYLFTDQDGYLTIRAVPEPAGTALGAFAALLVLNRRRR